jgi:Domain of unknown function (DUF4232)
VRIALAAALAGLVLGAGASPAALPAPCRAGQLAGTFSVVPGSAGAGNIVYALRLRNRSAATCFVSGLPRLRLLDRYRHALPTHVTPAQPGAGTAVIVRLAPGAYASASTRFTPDVAAPNERQHGDCEPKAYAVRVGAPPGSGTLVAPVKPPTPVCQHGALQVSLLVAGRRPPHT